MRRSHAVAVLLDDELLTLNRAVGVLRRRNVAIERLALSPGGGGGPARLTFEMTADDATADRVVQQFHKIIGVRDVQLMRTGEEGCHHE